MGNTLQKILQRRRSKEGQGLELKSVFPFVFLFFSYLGLLLEYPQSHKEIWFVSGISTVVLCGFFHLKSEEKKYSVEFLFSLSIMFAATLQILNVQWLKILYFPFLISLSFFYGKKTIIPLSILMPFLEIKKFLDSQLIVENIVFFLTLFVTALISVLLFKSPERKEKENKKKNIEIDKDEDFLDESTSINDDKLISDYFESTFNPDYEMQEILEVSKKTIFADSVNLFTRNGEELKLRVSTDGIKGIITTDDGLITHCYKERKNIIATDMQGKRIEAGYVRKEPISSLIAVPITDGDFVLGVLTADSSRIRAFSSADLDTLKVFSNQIMKILQRERVYPQISRSFQTLKILNEESSKLLLSLKLETIVKNLIDSANRIAPGSVLLFLSSGRNYELFEFKEKQANEPKKFNLKGTLIELALKNKDPLVISNTKKYRMPVLPFGSGEIGSVLMLPLIYEKDILGLLVITSEKTDAFNSYQAGILSVLGNQASISMANARFHAEIEKIAITDGLTGLFNHRHFQERLLQEFKRHERFAEPMSLLLIDIDFFKKVNDTYGHPVGDSVLKGVANIILKTIRNIDIAARYGGEEFAVVLIGTDVNGAKNMAERLRKTIADVKFKSDRNIFNVTISIGITTWSKELKSTMDFIDRADKALYNAKNSGRNRYVVWEEIKS